jgi:DNA-binding IclR family transcriptional regulator
MPDGTGRTLKTAHAVLRVLRLLHATPSGLTAGEVADQLGRSRSTAINLLNTLCAEGFAERDDHDARYRAGGLTGPATSSIDTAALRTLYERTNERTYLATAEPARIVVQESQGRQGLPYVPGLTPSITNQAHALAVGKAFLAHLGPDALDRHVDAHGLSAFTGRTVTEPDRLRANLHEVRAQGVAVDVEEFAEGHCCIAAPLLGHDGKLLGALALSVNVRRFRAQGKKLTQEVAAAARNAIERVEYATPLRLEALIHEPRTA